MLGLSYVKLPKSKCFLFEQIHQQLNLLSEIWNLLIFF